MQKSLISGARKHEAKRQMSNAFWPQPSTELQSVFLSTFYPTTCILNEWKGQSLEKSVTSYPCGNHTCPRIPFLHGFCHGHGRKLISFCVPNNISWVGCRQKLLTRDLDNLTKWFISKLSVNTTTTKVMLFGSFEHVICSWTCLHTTCTNI